jgi:hypothetical protein
VREHHVIDGHDGVEARRFGKLHHPDGTGEVGEGVVAKVQRKLHHVSLRGLKASVFAAKVAPMTTRRTFVAAAGGSIA